MREWKFVLMSTRKEELERKKRLAFTLFVENGFEQKVIAEITGISANSITTWKRDGNWEEERRMTLLGPDKQMRRIMRMYDVFLTMIEERKAPHNVPDSKEADILNKMADSVKKLQADLTLFMKSEVGKQFIAYVQQTHGQARAIECVDLWHEYLMATS